jgi:hypothetical protein
VGGRIVEVCLEFDARVGTWRGGGGAVDEKNVVMMINCRDGSLQLMFMNENSRACAKLKRASMTRARFFRCTANL